MNHALAVLGWSELPEQDQPPEHIWLDSEAINKHFEEVRARYASPGASSGGMEPIDDGDGYMDNELTRGLRDRLRG